MYKTKKMNMTTIESLIYRGVPWWLERYQEVLRDIFSILVRYQVVLIFGMDLTYFGTDQFFLGVS